MALYSPEQVSKGHARFRNGRTLCPRILGGGSLQGNAGEVPAGQKVRNHSLEDCRMSGGALDYAYEKLDRAIEEMAQYAYDEKHRDRVQEFVDHLEKVSKALRDVEWMLSGDIGEEEMLDSINEVFEHAVAAQWKKE